MDKVLVLSTLLICMVYLPDILNCIPRFPMEIEGFEKDCVNYSCRYTGRILGHVDIYQENLTFPVVEYTSTISIFYCLGMFDCSDGSRDWTPICDIFWFVNPLNCVNNDYYPCFCSGTFPMKFKFYPIIGNAYYRLGLFIGNKRPKPADYGKVFDPRNITSVWDPIEKFDVYWEGKEYEFSVNEGRLLHSESVFLGIGALCAFLLA
ncbi:uncharacterized protein LOC131931080 isoform X1 [Physella acuta]|uniref:uncharacterized protein LOC131931080 isoform X1 n=2 Tax=Physella acuta TaxID=109671 RepID=UPI0027DC4B51|nr:uncharacterized protein LOC131931080 isoform X1 [Physella acuta]